MLIEEPKWCGKTTSAEQIAASILYMDDPEKKEQKEKDDSFKGSIGNIYQSFGGGDIYAHWKKK